MPTTSDYLTQLQQDREDLIDNLETQGIDDLTGDETFTELVPRVLDIETGGGVPRLPSAYQEVEYIQSTGTQYIDTGVNASSDLTISVEIISPDLTRQNGIIYSGGVGWQNQYIQGECDSEPVFHYGNNYYSNIRFASGGSVINFTQDRNKIYIGDSTTPTYTFPESTFQTTWHIYLFCYNRSGSKGEYGSHKLSKFTISENDVLVRNFVPCYRKSDSVIGLYDLVNNTFYTNSGSGSFLKGNDKDTSAKMQDKSVTIIENTTTLIEPDEGYDYLNSVEVTTNVPAGGGATNAVASDVNFYDYDGTLVNSYSKEDFAQLSAMPTPPTHNGLTNTGWTYTLSEAKEYVEECGMLDVGATYVTDDGSTRIHIKLPEGRLEPYVSFGINGTATVDWGDGSEPSVVTGTSTGILYGAGHTYESVGEYTITISSESTLYFSGVTYGCTLVWKNYTAQTDYYEENRIYQSSIIGIEVGPNVKLKTYAFGQAFALKTMMLSDGVTTDGNVATPFHECFSLVHLTIPNGFSTNNQLFNNNYNLKTICFGKNSVVKMNTFANCRALSSLTIPPSTTSISATSILSDANSLQRISIPSTVAGIMPSLGGTSRPALSRVYIGSGITSVSSFASLYSLKEIKINPNTQVTYFPANFCSNCYSLEEFTIPASITTLASQMFYNCRGLQKIVINSTNITSIPEAFCRSCYAIKSINIPSSVTSIGNYAFNDCPNINEWVMPSGLTSVGQYGFGYEYGVVVHDYSSCTSVPTLGANAFMRIASDCKIVVPDELYSDWIVATNWANYITKIVKASDYFTE